MIKNKFRSKFKNIIIPAQILLKNFHSCWATSRQEIWPYIFEVVIS